MFSSFLSAPIDSPEDRIVAAARAGEAGAWQELVERYQPGLVRFLTAQVGDPEAAADLAQETFLDAWRRLDRLPPGRPFAPWLYRIARYHFLPWWRRHRLLWFISVEVLAERRGEPPAVLRRPDDFVAVVEEQDLARRALAGLSPLAREALLLREFGGLKPAEIAKALGISQEAAERRVGRATAEFRRRYAELSSGATGNEGAEGRRG